MLASYCIVGPATVRILWVSPSLPTSPIRCRAMHVCLPAMCRLLTLSQLCFTLEIAPAVCRRVLYPEKEWHYMQANHHCLCLCVYGTRQAQLSRLEQELQQLRERGASPDSSSPLVAAEAAAASIAPGGVSHAEAVDAELAELTRVNSQLRGEIVARSTAWREEKVNHCQTCTARQCSVVCA